MEPAPPGPREGGPGTKWTAPWSTASNWRWAWATNTSIALRGRRPPSPRRMLTKLGYGNEAEVGIAIKESKMPRSDLYVTTKVMHGTDDIEAALRASLKKLQLDRVDL